MNKKATVFILDDDDINLMLLEEDYLTICDYCGEFFIKHKNDLIGHTYTVNNITKHICPDCYEYKNK